MTEVIKYLVADFVRKEVVTPLPTFREKVFTVKSYRLRGSPSLVRNPPKISPEMGNVNQNVSLFFVPQFFSAL